MSSSNLFRPVPCTRPLILHSLQPTPEVSKCVSSVCFIVWRSSVQHTTAENFLFYHLSSFARFTVYSGSPRTEENFASSEDVRKKTRARKTIAQKINKGFFWGYFSTYINFYILHTALAFLLLAVINFFYLTLRPLLSYSRLIAAHFLLGDRISETSKIIILLLTL